MQNVEIWGVFVSRLSFFASRFSFLPHVFHVFSFFNTIIPPKMLLSFVMNDDDSMSSTSSFFSIINFISQSSTLYDSKKPWNDFIKLRNWKNLFYVWDQMMEHKMTEIIQAKNVDQKLQLQRKLTYRRNLQQDEWAHNFLHDIAIIANLHELLQQHIFDNARDLHANEMKNWMKFIEFDSISFSLFRFLSSSLVKRILRSLPSANRQIKTLKIIQNEKSVKKVAKTYKINCYEQW